MKLEKELVEETCLNCKYCKRGKELVNRKWIYKNCCTLFIDCADILGEGEILIDTGNGVCEMHEFK